MRIDTSFKVYSDSNGKDPDIYSKTLRSFHSILWSKPLPNGKTFELSEKPGTYLFHRSELGEYCLGSDAITHSYKNQKRKQWLVKQITKEVDELYEIGSTIGAFIVFPKNQIDRKWSINQARGVIPQIDDRFDLTLECIRLFYQEKESPLFETLSRYRDFFDLFESFSGYVNFFLLNDLLDENQTIKFFLPFDGFQSRWYFTGIDDYLLYKNEVTQFIISRNRRIEEQYLSTNP